MSVEIAQMDAVSRLAVAIKRIEEKDAEIERLDTLLSEAVASRDVKIARLRAALKPFAKNANAWSISLALGHITREDLLRAAEVFGVGSVGSEDGRGHACIMNGRVVCAVRSSDQ